MGGTKLVFPLRALGAEVPSAVRGDGRWLWGVLRRAVDGEKGWVGRKKRGCSELVIGGRPRTFHVTTAQWQTALRLGA